jgi:hypothetical protein
MATARPARRVRRPSFTAVRGTSHAEADSEPPWLDRLLAAEGGTIRREDLAPLAAALKGLEAVL